MQSSTYTWQANQIPGPGANRNAMEGPVRMTASPAARDAMRPVRVVIAGGGTGGHLFPGIAIAEEIMARNEQSHVLFVGTGNAFETSVLGEKGYSFAAITVQGLKNRGIVNQAKALMMLPTSLIASARILKAFGPDLVLGVGGYSAGPVVAAAWLKGIKTALQEQNILPGITNRLLARIADRLYLSFPDTKGLAGAEKALVSGNPVRQEFSAAVQAAPQAPETTAGSAGLFTVLIAGGSQGAHAINMAMQSALDHITGGERFHFIHQTGADDESTMKTAYAKSHATSEVRAFFMDMANQYHAADLIVCRAGATTVAEVTALGKPVIFIPFPHAADDHQRLNAESLVRQGASEMILERDLDGETLARRIEHYAGTPEELARMGARTALLGRPEAARTIVDDIYELIAGRS